MREVEISNFKELINSESSKENDKELAKKIGIAVETIKAWRRGEANPTSFNAQAFLDATGYELTANGRELRLDDVRTWVDEEIISRDIRKRDFARLLGYNIYFVGCIEELNSISLKKLQDMMNRLGYKIYISKKGGQND